MNYDYGLNRTVRREVLLSPEEDKIMQDMADKEGVTVSDYLRWMGLWAALKSGHRGAWKWLRDKLGGAARERMQRFYDALRLPGIRKMRMT